MEKLIDFTIVFTGKCNLSCKYCPLLHDDQEISYEMLDAYVDFFYLNQKFLSEHTESLELLLFGGEPCLIFDRVKYFIDKMLDFPIKTIFKIYSNATRLSKEICLYISSIPDYQSRIILFLSIDGDVDQMLINRLSTPKQFEYILESVVLLKEFSITFNISKVISEISAKDLLKSLLFIHSLGPLGLYLYPATFSFYTDLSRKDMTEIIRGLDLFIHHLRTIGYLKKDIMHYININDYMNTSLNDQIDVGIIGDWDGKIYGILEAVSIFSTKTTFSTAQINAITLGNIGNHKEILDVISEYTETKKRISLIGLEWYQKQYPNELRTFSMLHEYCTIRFSGSEST